MFAGSTKSGCRGDTIWTKTLDVSRNMVLFFRAWYKLQFFPYPKIWIPKTVTRHVWLQGLALHCNWALLSWVDKLQCAKRTNHLLMTLSFLVLSVFFQACLGGFSFSLKLQFSFLIFTSQVGPLCISTQCWRRQGLWACESTHPCPECHERAMGSTTHWECHSCVWSRESWTRTSIFIQTSWCHCHAIAYGSTCHTCRACHFRYACHCSYACHCGSYACHCGSYTASGGKQ